MVRIGIMQKILESEKSRYTPPISQQKFRYMGYIKAKTLNLPIVGAAQP